MLQAQQAGSHVKADKSMPSTGNLNPDGQAQLAQAPQHIAKVEPKDPGEPAFRLPPVTAIAGVLIRDWAEGKIRFGAGKVHKEHL
jgi:hypothetical protein